MRQLAHRQSSDNSNARKELHPSPHALKPALHEEKEVLHVKPHNLTQPKSSDIFERLLWCGCVDDLYDTTTEELERREDDLSILASPTGSGDEGIGMDLNSIRQTPFHGDLDLHHGELRNREGAQHLSTPKSFRKDTQAEKKLPRPPLSPHPVAVSGGTTTELHRLAKSGDWQMLRSILTKAANHSRTIALAGQADEKGRTPLMLACKHGSRFPADVARLLLVASTHSASTFVAQQRNGGELTCLHAAVTTGCSLEILDLLYGAFPPAASMVDSNGNMPLHLATNNGKYRCVAKEIGIEKGRISKDTILIHVENTPDLLASKREVSNCDSISLTSSCESSFAGGIAGFDDDELLVNVCETLILAYPQALHHRNRKGETPLLLAMYRRASYDVLSLLLTKGGAISVQIPDDFGSLPLHFCYRSTSIKIVRDMARLYPEGVMSLNNLGESPLYSAMLDTCDAAILRVMLEVCPEPRKTVNNENARGISVIEFGWDALMTPKIVAAEDQDEEDARLDSCKNTLQAAKTPLDIDGTPVGKWWEKAAFLLQAAYYNAVMFDETTGLVGTRVWSPAHAVAGTACPPEMVKFVLHIYAHDIMSRDENGNTPYHIAALCHDVIGSEAMKIVADSCPPSALVQNKDGNTPLHLVCLFDVPLEILEIMLKSSPKALRVTNNAGHTPLFIALSMGRSIAVIRMLLKACPESVHIRDANGMSPIELAWNMLLSGTVVEDSRESNGQEITKQCRLNINTLAVCARSSSLGGNARVWMGKIDLLLRTSFHGTAESRLPKGRRWRAVHAACAGGTCNHDVLAFSLQILPFELKVKNEDLNLPLHIAASAPPYEQFRPPELGSGDSLRMVLNLFPDGAKVTNRKGRLPLHIALASCKTVKNGAKELTEAFPEAARMRDPVSMLFPFMLAASAGTKEDTLPGCNASSGESTKMTTNADLASIETIYLLLQEAPELVRTLRGNAEMHYLRRRNTELRAEVELLKKQEHIAEAEVRRRMTREELREKEDNAKIAEIRNKEEECRSRADYLERKANDIKGAMSSLASSMMKMRTSSLHDC